MFSDIRCRWFDEDGQPIGRGCSRAATCGFAHPGQDNWKTARSSNHGGKGRPYEDGGSSRTQGKHDRKGSWNAPPSASANSEFNTSAWAPLPTSAGKGKANANTTQLAATGRTWGTVGTAAAVDMSTPSTTAPAGTGTAACWEEFAKSYAQPSDSWGASENAWGQGSGTEGTSAWNNKEGESSTQATGESTIAWGKGSEIAEAAGWKEKIENKGKEKEKANIPTPPPSHLRKDLSPLPISPQIPSLKSHATVLPTSNPRGQKPSQSRDQTDSPITSSSTLKHESLPHLRKEALTVLTGIAKMSSAGSNLSTPTSATFPSNKTYSGPEGHADLFADTIKAMRNLVIFEVMYHRAEEDEARCKIMRKCPEYERATLLARTILDRSRTNYAAKVHPIKARRDRALATLLSLPDLSTKTSKKILGPMETKEAIQSYTQEIKDWFKDLQMHKRLLMAEKLKEETILNNPEAQVATASLTFREILDKEDWTWRDLRSAAEMLRSSINTTSELLYSDIFTKADDDMDDMVAEFESHLSTAAQENQDEDMHDYTAIIQKASSNIGVVCNNLEADAGQVTELLTKIAGLKQELATLRAERKKMDEICAEAEAKFAELDRQKEEDNTEIQEVTSRIQKLYLHKRRSTKPAPPPEPVKIDDVLELIRPVVANQLKTDLDPVFQALALRCRENQASLMTELDEMVRPLQEETDRLYSLRT